MKLAFLFLTQDDHNQGELWEAFFGNLSRERYSIFCHPKFPDRVTQPFLRDNIIPETINTGHADISLVRATILLLTRAFMDPQNNFFILLSESCIPLFGIDQILKGLSRSGKSLISYEAGVPGELRTTRCLQLRDPSFLASNRFAKQHQWMALHRPLVEIILQHDFTDVFEKMYAPDEHYFINLLIKLNLPLDNLIANQQVTFVNWQELETEKVSTRDSEGRTITLSRIRPKTYQHLSTTDIVAARKMGCLFFRKVSPSCDVSYLTRLVRVMNNLQ